jgi:TP901-1 family phage major tail protein
MAKQKGSDLLLKLDTTGGGNFVTIGGVQNATLRFRVGDAEVTNQGSPGKYRELLEGAGIKSMSVSGSGVFDTAAPQSTVRQVVMDALHRRWQVIVPGEGIYDAKFQVTQYERRGQHERDVTFDITLESDGLVTFTAA